MTHVQIPAVTEWGLTTDTPLVLLPVRLETRFFGTELRIRIFPDAIHIDSHIPELTDAEIDDATAYWERLETGDASAAAEAWTWLSGLYGAPRAGWIARVMEPAGGVFPTPSRQPATGSTRAPQARAMPTRWYAVGVSAGHDPAFAVSAPVSTDLTVGPASGGAPSEVPADQVPLDPSSRWLVDYQEALDRGMALALPLSAQVAAQGLDELFVFGVAETAAPLDSARVLSELFEAQSSTAGLSYLAAGTPTNLSASPDATYPQGTGATEVLSTDLAPSAPGANGPRIAAAMGIPTRLTSDSVLNATRGTPARADAPTAIGRVAGSALESETAARAAADTLWGATWGYFLPTMTGHDPGGEVIRRIRDLYTGFIRPGGPLPTMQIGRQPYGVLPAMSLDSWVDREGDPAHESGVGLLRALRDRVWIPSVPSVPVIRPGLDNPDAALLHVLGMGESSTISHVRTLLGNDYVTYLWRFSRLKLDDGWQESRALGLDRILTDLGLTDLDMPIARAIFSGSVYELGGPLVLGAAGDTSYLMTFAGSAISIRDNPELAGGPTPLLYRLLRHAALTEYDAAARAVAVRHSLDRPDDVFMPELIDLQPGLETQTLWRRLARTFTGEDGTPITIGSYLAAATGDPQAGDPDTARRRQFRAALQTLSMQEPAELERHLMGAIDLAAYRLDAWLTGYATRRLEWLRDTQPGGVHLGGYGWLTDVRARPAAPATPTPPGESGTVHRAPDGAAYIHAPSLAQANTAAVLRSGYRTHTGPDGAANPYAVNVTSRRARLARRLLDGIRQGQSLGALLGYRFERGLHDADRLLDRYLPYFRQLAPVLGTRVDPDGGVHEVVAATGTVDGLALHRVRPQIDWRSDPSLPDPGSDDYAAIHAVLDDLDEAIDALADALLAESVHHAVQGNPMRAGASLDAASRGDVPPPDLEFVRTPRTGVGVTHRLILLANSGTADRSAWPVDSTQLRAVADPAADALASSLLPPPGAARARLSWRAPGSSAADPSTGDYPGADTPEGVTAELALDALRLSALDYVLMPGADHAAADSELVQRIVLEAMAGPRPAGVGADWRVDVRTDRDPTWPPDVLSVAEFAQAASAVRGAFGSGHRLDNADLVTPDVEPAPTAPGSLASRATAAIAAATRLAADLDSTDAAQLRTALTSAAALGIGGALPPPPGAAAATAITAAAGPIQREIHRRLQAAGALTDDPVGALRALFGDEFPALAECTASAPLQSAYTASVGLQGGDPLAARDWLTRHARVRAGADRLHEALGYAEALGATTLQTLSVAQLPYADGDRWLGLPHGDGTPAGSRTSFVFATPRPVNLHAPLTGIAVDEWTEVIPNRSETTGVTFEYDAPGAMAPQSILIAVPADTATEWTASAVLDTLTETLDLARVRAVDPDSLTDLGQFLPALCFPVNVDPQIGATDFTASAAAASTEGTVR